MTNEEYYKIYVGRFEKDDQGICSAPTIYSSVPFKYLGIEVGKLTKMVRHGMDIYIKKPSGAVYAYYRDIYPLPREERYNLLKP